MTQSLAKKQFCILLYGNIEVWVDEEKWEILDKIIDDREIQMIAISGRKGRLNKSHIIGTFSSDEMEEAMRRKNGQWKCKGNNWHDRHDKCQCATNEEKTRIKLKEEAIKACGKCSNGYVEINKTIYECDCTIEFFN